jgi:Fe-S-cluster-containing hydrogenase component 2
MVLRFSLSLPALRKNFMEPGRPEHRLLFTQPRTCVGCRSCEAYCAYRHYGENNPSRALLRVVKFENTCVDIPVVCQHCGNAPCIQVCPTGAITRDPKTGAVVISQEACIQCRVCMTACPYSVIFADPKTGAITKCDLCGGDPMCVKVCPKHVIMYTRRDVGPRVLTRAAHQPLANSVAEAWRTRFRR